MAFRWWLASVVFLCSCVSTISAQDEPKLKPRPAHFFRLEPWRNESARQWYGKLQELSTRSTEMHGMLTSRTRHGKKRYLSILQQLEAHRAALMITESGYENIHAVCCPTCPRIRNQGSASGNSQ